MRSVIITAQPQNIPAARNEILKIDPKARCISRLGDGVESISLEMPYGDFFDKILEKPPVFIRHIQPVHWMVTDGDVQQNLETLALIIVGQVGGLSTGRTFAVHTRMFGGRTGSFQAHELTKKISAYYMADGYTLNVKEPEQILSVTCSSSTIYLGLSTPKENLSAWPGGEVRFAKREGQISRAEFKLLEAVEIFNLDISTRGPALDLGAAPGGFTRILRQFGNKVVAVDPAALDTSLLEDQGVTHAKMTAQEFFSKKPAEAFSILVNDMRMDYNESIDIMIEAKPFLTPDCICLMTLKLPSGKQQKAVQKGLAVLAKHFHIIGARQLFHNRTEVTVVFKP